MIIPTLNPIPRTLILYFWQFFFQAPMLYSSCTTLPIQNKVFQLHPVWGPMQLTLMRTAKDILYFVIVLVVFITCAALGIQLLYVNYEDEWRIEEGEFDPVRVQCVKQGDSLEDTAKTFKTLFWHLYGYGETDDADLVVRNRIAGNLTDDDKAVLCDPNSSRESLEGKLSELENRLNATRDELWHKMRHQPTEFMGYTIVFLYDLTAIVILLNILVAMMNNTFGDILGNSQSEWKFSKGE